MNCDPPRKNRRLTAIFFSVPKNCREAGRSLGSGPPAALPIKVHRPSYSGPGYSSACSVWAKSVRSVSYFRHFSEPNLVISVMPRPQGLPGAHKKNLHPCALGYIVPSRHQEHMELWHPELGHFWTFYMSPIQNPMYGKPQKMYVFRIFSDFTSTQLRGVELRFRHQMEQCDELRIFAHLARELQAPDTCRDKFVWAGKISRGGILGRWCWCHRRDNQNIS